MARKRSSWRSRASSVFKRITAPFRSGRAGQAPRVSNVERKRSFKESFESRRFLRKMRKQLGFGKDWDFKRIRQEMNAASSADKVSMMSGDAVKSFFALTRDIWNRDDVDPSQRLEAIMQYFGTSDLREAMDRALIEAEQKVRERGYEGDFNIRDYQTMRLFGTGFFSVAG